VAGPAVAQQRPGGGGLADLLRNKSVQDELKLDKEQRDKVVEAVKKFREDHKDDLDKLRPGSSATPEDKAEALKRVYLAGHKAATDILKPEQLMRLKQIRLQVEGANALADEDVQKALNLTDKQKDEVKALVED